VAVANIPRTHQSGFSDLDTAAGNAVCWCCADCAWGFTHGDQHTSVYLSAVAVANIPRTHQSGFSNLDTAAGNAVCWCGADCAWGFTHGDQHTSAYLSAAANNTNARGNPALVHRFTCGDQHTSVHLSAVAVANISRPHQSGFSDVDTG
jgi:hypothetical protein